MQSCPHHGEGEACPSHNVAAASQIQPASQSACQSDAAMNAMKYTPLDEVAASSSLAALQNQEITHPCSPPAAASPDQATIPFKRRGGMG